MRTLLLTSFVVLTSALFTACGQVPSAYRGTYVDAASGARLELSRSGGSFRSADGVSLSADSRTLEFRDLLKGEPGIYFHIDPQDEHKLELFWIEPLPGTRSEQNGFVWFQAKILYTRLNLEQDKKVDALLLVHSDQGTVMLDLPTQTWQVGWAPRPREYDMRRVED